jgi:hypothetical protein
MIADFRQGPHLYDEMPAPCHALEPLHIARSAGRLDCQFGVDALADVG